MKTERLRLTDDLEIETYRFSDYITCVEVYLDGEFCSSFCSDNHVVEEWIESPDLLTDLCRRNAVTQQQQEKPLKSNERIALEQDLEIEMYTFSEDVFCINVFQSGNMVTSFCTDKHTIDEWKEDKAMLTSVVKNFLK